MESHENLAPQVMTRIYKQLKTLMTKPPEGVSYTPTEGNISEIFADITGPETTPYEGGVFRVKLVLGKEYPAKPPRGFFLTKIFHPNVSDVGAICVNTLSKSWTPTTALSHVLQVIRCLLIVPFPESSLNDEAGKMFMESYDEYASHARLMTSIHALPSGSTPATATTTTLAASSSTSAPRAASLPAEDEESKTSPTGAPLVASATAAAAPTTAAAPGGSGSRTAAAVASPKRTSSDKKKDRKRADKSKESKKKSLKRL